MFQNYHYLNGKLDAGVRCYTALYQNKPVAFIAVACTKMKVKYHRVSRLVVLPDYQGIGIGKRLLNFIAELYTSQTHFPFYLVTSNPQLIRSNIDKWRLDELGMAATEKKHKNKQRTSKLKQPTSPKCFNNL